MSTQKELLKTFKQGSLDDAIDSVNLMNLDTLEVLMSSNLLCVKKKVKREEFYRKIIQKAWPQVQTKDSYTTLISFVRVNRAWQNLSWTFFKNLHDKLELEDVVDYGRNCYENPTYEDTSLFDNVLSRLSPEIRFTVHKGVTREFMVRMSEKEKIDFLKPLKASLEEQGNSDFSIRIECESLAPLYIDLPYDKVRASIHTSPKLLYHLAALIIKNDDKPLARKSLIVCDMNMKSGDMFKMLSFEDRMEVFKQDTGQRSLYASRKYADDIECGRAFYMHELPILMDWLVKCPLSNTREWITAAFEFARKQGNTSDLNLVLRNNVLTPIEEFPLRDTCGSLDNATKKHLIKEGYSFKGDSSNYYGYRDTASTMEAFFKTMSRNDLEELWGKDFHLKSPERVYFAHAMTPEERFAVAPMDGAFTRRNVELLGYQYFRRYEDNKNALKELVGDRRNRSNNAFYHQILKVFSEAGNPLRFILDLEEEMES